MFHKDLLDLLENLVRFDLWVDVVVFVELRVVFDDLFGFVFVSYKSLLYAVYVIVWAAACLASLEQTVQHHLLPTLQVQDKREIYLDSHNSLPSG